MKHKLITKENYLLVVDDSEIKEGELVLSKLFEIVHFGKNYTQSLYKKIIAHLPLNNSPILEGVDLLPPLEQEYGVEELAWELFGNDYNARARYKDGYNKAKEKYKYTEADIAKAITYGWDLSHYHRLNTEEKLLKMQRDFIKSLSQPKIPIGFECEKEWVNSYGSPTLQYDAQKLKPKTTTTLQDQSVWVGKYIYA
jgi:hypothetical protein